MQKTVNIVVATSIPGSSVPSTGMDAESLKKIQSVSPSIKVTDVTIPINKELRGDFSSKAALDAALFQAEVIFAFRLPPDIIKRAPKLKWVQMRSAGVERYLSPEMVTSPVVLTNASGLLAIPISEWVTMVMLMFAKRMPEYLELKKERKWQRLNANLLYGKTAGVVGLGNIGTEVAKRAKALGMRVVATRRSAKPGQRARYTDKLVTREQLPELLAESDYVVITLPFTPETNKMFGEKEFRTMKPTAYILNIGRGNIIDEEALIRALENKVIAGAGLDVFATEPLPPESKLWGMPNVIQTPHASGSWEGSITGPTDLFIDNLKRYVVGKRLNNRVDKKKGY